MKFALALDVGGSSLKGAIVSAEAEIVYKDTWPTERGRGPEHVVNRTIDFALRLEDEATRMGVDYAALGVVVPGLVDEARGIAMRSSNLRWNEVSFRDILSERFTAPVILGHDIRAGALAEARVGAGRDVSSLFFISLGTGIGGAIVFNGRPWPGASYSAGEIGHLPIVGFGARCACGREGCLEALASAAAIAQRYAGETGENAVDAAVVCRRMLAGDVVAKKVWSEAVDALAEVLRTVITVVNPELVVIGGGLSQAGEVLVSPLTDQVQKNAPVGKMPAIRLARLGDRAACVGAGLLALDSLDRG